MTQQEKKEIRQIVREELKNWEKQSLPYATPQYCQHEWVINPNPAGTGSFCTCKKCGAITVNFPPVITSGHPVITGGSYSSSYSGQ